MSPLPSDVSVVTINWNGRVHLETLLPSLQKTGCSEILVVDNNSNDGSKEFIRNRFPRVQLIENDRNQGFAHPCNQAVDKATTRYVAFINNDMKAHPDWLRSALPHLNKKTPCVASRILDWEGNRIDFNGSSLQYLGYALQRDLGRLLEDVSHEEEVLFPCGGALVIDREVFLKVGGFDRDYFAIFEDVDLGWRLWVMGYRIAFAADSITYHRQHSTLRTQETPKVRYLMHRNALFTILKNYDDHHFQKILPLAVAMAVKRAVHFSGANRESFYLWSDLETDMQSGNMEIQDKLLDSLTHLVAVDDVLEHLPYLLEKRNQIQKRRRRTDKKIFDRFIDPFRLIVEDPNYAYQELRHLDQLDFTTFKPTSHQKVVMKLPDQLEKKIQRLSQELSQQQWMFYRNLTTVSFETKPLLSRFFRSLRENGFRNTWKLLKERVEDGL